MQLLKVVPQQVGQRARPCIDKLVAANTAWIRTIDPSQPNPREIDDEAWAINLVASHSLIRSEWDRFLSDGFRLPLIDDLLGGPQGSEHSWWKAGVLVVRGRPSSPLSEHFPATVDALMRVPGLISVMLSMLGPGGELPPHTGPNSGALRLLVGVDVPDEAGHTIEGTPVSLHQGGAVLFDDSYLHSAWNHSTRPRIVLLGDVLRPLPFGAHTRNRAVQFIRHHLTPEYHLAPKVGASWHHAGRRHNLPLH